MTHRSSFDLFSLAGRVAVVTGGGTHIGLALSAALAEAGAKVIMAGRRGAVVEAAAEKLRSRGLDVHARPADVSRAAGADELVSWTTDTHGRLDVMVCNAGGSVAVEPVPDASDEALQATLVANVHTAFHGAQAATKAMLPQRAGSIVLLSSVHARLGSDKRLYGPGFTRSGVLYQTAKGAVLNLARGLACEVAEHGIRVNTLSPGHVPKPNVDERTMAPFVAATPLGRVGSPEDLKGAAILLASDAGRWITGHDLVVDGGWSAW